MRGLQRRESRTLRKGLCAEPSCTVCHLLTSHTIPRKITINRRRNEAKIPALKGLGPLRSGDVSREIKTCWPVSLQSGFQSLISQRTDWGDCSHEASHSSTGHLPVLTRTALTSLQYRPHISYAMISPVCHRALSLSAIMSPFPATTPYPPNPPNVTLRIQQNRERKRERAGESAVSRRTHLLGHTDPALFCRAAVLQRRGLRKPCDPSRPRQLHRTPQQDTLRHEASVRPGEYKTSSLESWS